MCIRDSPKEILPKVRPSSFIYGKTKSNLFKQKIAISGIAGDQQAALFGQNCIEPGMVKNTYGTGCFMLMNTGDKPIRSDHNLLTTIAWMLDNKVEYALEGSVFMGGAIVQWLRDGLGIINSSEEIETVATSIKDSGGVYLVPAFAGMGAPHWDPHARGLITGLTRGSTSAHIARAALESIAYQCFDLLIAKKDVQFVEHSVSEIIVKDNIEVQINIFEGEKKVVEKINIKVNNVNILL